MLGCTVSDALSATLTGLSVEVSGKLTSESVMGGSVMGGSVAHNVKASLGKIAGLYAASGKGGFFCAKGGFYFQLNGCGPLHKASLVHKVSPHDYDQAWLLWILFFLTKNVWWI